MRRYPVPLDFDPAEATATCLISTLRPRANRPFSTPSKTRKYEREIINGLAPFFNERAPEDMLHFYTKDELAELMQLKGRSATSRRGCRSR
jgi:hypothetical protein